MKKIFFSLLAIAAIASCAKTEDVFTEGDSEIKLSPVTALQTKADATGKPNFTGSVDGIVYPVQENFDVYAYWKNVPAGEKFVDGAQTFLTAGTAGVEFTNKGNYWGGVLDYYWPKNGSLRFSAYSPSHLAVQHDLAKDCYTIENYQQPNLTDKTWDFLVAPTSPSYSLMTATEKVAIEFQHALSWLTLNVQAKDAAAANKFEIKKVTINNVNTVADFAAEMANGIQFTEWSNPESPAPYVVFEGSQTVTEDAAVIETTPKGTIVIPQHTTTVTIEFTQYGVNGTPDMEGMVVNLDLILDGSEPWEPGKHYIYNLIFGLDKILINPSVADWKDVEVVKLEADATSNVSTEAQLKAALLKGGKIVFQADLAGQYEVNEVDGKTIIIDGNGYKFDGTFTIVGNSTYGEATTVFKNIHFETADASAFPGASFIWSDSQDAPTRYPDNVTITNCTFNATGAAKHAAVGAKFRQLEGDVVIEDTKVEGMHSLLQIQSASKTDVSVSGVKMTDCKNGLSLDDAWRTTIRNSEISTIGYGVRAKGCNATTTIENSTIEANQPVIVRYLTTGTYNVVLDEAILKPGQPFAVVFTNGKDDAPFAVPTGKYTITGADGYSIFPDNAAISKETFEAALANADTDMIDLVVDLGYAANEAISIEKDVVINGNDNTITAGGDKDLTPSVAVMGAHEVVLNEVNIEGGFVGAYYGSDLTVNGGSLKFTDGMSGRNCFYAASNNETTSVITINGVDVNMANASGNSYLCAHGNAVIYVKGGNFYGKPAGSSHAYVKEAAIGSYTGEVIITGGTFNFDPSEWVPAGYAAVNNGSTWTVSAE